MFLSFSGYIRLRLNSENPAFFFNECKKRGYPVSNITKTDDTYSMDILSKHYKDISELASLYGINCKINGRFGFLMKLILYKSRKAFFALLVLLSIYYGINSCFISEIELSGNKIFADSQILECLKKHGLQKGSLRFGIDPEIFREDVLKDFSGLSWLWLEIDGTKAIVDVREKISKPEFFNPQYYCNVVASRDGVIKSAVSSAGSVVVSEGMFVQKGDILISGVYDSSDFAPVRFVNAGGIVHAATTYSLSDRFSCKFVNYTPSFQNKNLYSLKIGDINLTDTTKQAPLVFDTEKTTKKFRLFGKKYLPLAFTKTKYCEIIKTECTLSIDDAQRSAVDELSQRLMQNLPDGAKVTDTRETITPHSDGSFSVEITFECIEDIAEKQQILLE